MAMDSGIDVGDIVRLVRLITDESGDPVDPDTVSLVLTSPGDYTTAPDVREATEDELPICAAMLGVTLEDTTGVWTVEVEATEHGLWRYEWRSTGPQSVEPGSFNVRRSRVGNSIASSPGSSAVVAGGDLYGTYPNPSVHDDSHAHTSATVTPSGIGAATVGHAHDASYDPLGEASSEVSTHAALDAGVHGLDDILARLTDLEGAGGGSGGSLRAAAITLTPSNLTDSVTLPAGAVLVDILGDNVETWDGGAVLDIDFAGLDTMSNLWSTIDLTAFWGGNDVPPGVGASLYAMALTQSVSLIRGVPAGGAITATVTATDPTMGETPITVIYAVPSAGEETSLGAARLIDVGVISVTDLLDGPFTVADEVVLGVWLSDPVAIDQPWYIKVWPGQLTSWAEMQPTAFLAFMADTGNINTIGEVPGALSLGAKAWLIDGSGDIVQGAWASGHAYFANDTIIAAGHTWYAGGDGTSDVSEPDFAGNIGNPVTDNDLTWFDIGVAPSTGSVHVHALVATPVAP